MGSDLCLHEAELTAEEDKELKKLLTEEEIKIQDLEKKNEELQKEVNEWKGKYEEFVRKYFYATDLLSDIDDKQKDRQISFLIKRNEILNKMIETYEEYTDGALDFDENGEVIY